MAVTILAAGMMLHGNAWRQQPPASTASHAPAQKAPLSPAVKSPAAKTGQASAAKSKSDATLGTEKDKLSYAIGVNVGRSLQKDSVEVDPTIVVQGLKDALAGGKTLMTDDEAKAVIVALQTDSAQKAGSGDAGCQKRIALFRLLSSCLHRRFLLFVADRFGAPQSRPLASSSVMSVLPPASASFKPCTTMVGSTSTESFGGSCRTFTPMA